MSNENKVWLAHELLDEINARQDLTPEQTEVLRSFLPELPKQKTLEDIAHDVYDAWIGSDGNEWPDDAYGVLESWLYGLYKQLRGLAFAESAHPEFLETEADYENAPSGTVVAVDGIATSWVKRSDTWASTNGRHEVRCPILSYGTRRVLRWGWGE